jgi:hypothetical protein
MGSLGSRGGLNKWLSERPVFRFVLFLLFMGVLMGWGIARLVGLYSAHPLDSGKITIAVIVYAAILIPTVVWAGSLGRSEVSTPKGALALGVIVAAGVLGYPALSSVGSRYAADGYWMQPALDVVLLAFPPVAVWVRVRQRFWRSDWTAKG